MMDRRISDSAFTFCVYRVIFPAIQLLTSTVHFPYTYSWTTNFSTANSSTQVYYGTKADTTTIKGPNFKATDFS